MVNFKECADEVTEFAAPYLKKAGEYIYIAKDGVIHYYKTGKKQLAKLRKGNSKTALDVALDIALVAGAVILLAGSLAMFFAALKRRDD